MKDEQIQQNQQNHRRNSRKRKRHNVKKQQNTTEKGKSKSKRAAEKEVKPLKGLVLAISTLDIKDEKHASTDLSYQAVSALCTDLGAEVGNHEDVCKGKKIRTAILR